jgi:ectoine hydroxylase-related dioxygenase (phytanoyl-CoA dioxygenase family)
VQQQALDALRNDGVAVVSFADLFGDADLWAELEADMRAFVEETERVLPTLSVDERRARFGNKWFLVRRFRAGRGESLPTLGVDNPWVRLGVAAQLLDVVNAFRGEMMRLHDVDNWYTAPEGDEAERVLSQKWHRDGWENHIVKVFTYFTDVDEETGPFEYVRGSAEGGKYGALWPWQDEEVYPEQDAFAAAVDPSDCVTLTGPPGTVVICDTSGYHRGGYARAKPRILSYHTYLSDAENRKHRRKFQVDHAGSADLSEAGRSALS